MSNIIKNLYVFIPGKNWKLSLAELFSHFETFFYQYQILEINSSFFIFKIDSKIESSIIDLLGGILKIATVSFAFPTKYVFSAFNKADKPSKLTIKSLPFNEIITTMCSVPSAHIFFGLNVYWAESKFKKHIKQIHRFFGSIIKHQLAEHGVKAKFMGFSKNRIKPQLTEVEVIKKNLVNKNSDILVCIGKNETFVCRTISVHNPFEFQKRDIEKPVQRKIFGIPPRLAKIMVNLSHCKIGQIFLDPFCGVGTILQEALLAKANVVGVDINRWCVEASKKNLEWICYEYSLDSVTYSIFHGDSTKLTSKFREQIDCVATEPDLGPALLQVPTIAYAKKIVHKLRPLYFDFLNEVYALLKKDGFLVIVEPYIKTRSKNVITLNLTDIAVYVGFKPYSPFNELLFSKTDSNFSLLKNMHSFLDFNERHKIGRKINVFQK